MQKCRVSRVSFGPRGRPPMSQPHAQRESPLACGSMAVSGGAAEWGLEDASGSERSPSYKPPSLASSPFVRSVVTIRTLQETATIGNLCNVARTFLAASDSSTRRRPAYVALHRGGVG